MQLMARLRHLKIGKIDPVELARQAALIAVGSLAFGAGLSWFLVLYKIAPGGVGGLSQILFHFFGFPVGISMIVMNIPLWIIGMIFVGRQFGFGTFIGFFTSAVAVDFLSPRNLYRWGILRDMFDKYNILSDGSIKPLNQWA